MKTESRFYNFLIGTLSLIGVLALAGLLISCRLLERPDAFDQMFEAVAAQSAAQIHMTPPKSAAANWRNWQLAQPVKLEESK